MRAHAAILEHGLRRPYKSIRSQTRKSFPARTGRNFRNPVGFTVRDALAKLLEELAGDMDAVRASRGAGKTHSPAGGAGLHARRGAVCFVFLLKPILCEQLGDGKFPDFDAA